MECARGVTSVMRREKCLRVVEKYAVAHIMRSVTVLLPRAAYTVTTKRRRRWCHEFRAGDSPMTDMGRRWFMQYWGKMREGLSTHRAESIAHWPRQRDW